MAIDEQLSFFPAPETPTPPQANPLKPPKTGPVPSRTSTTRTALSPTPATSTSLPTVGCRWNRFARCWNGITPNSPRIAAT
jgi:hypothetical protein